MKLSLTSQTVFQLGPHEHCSTGNMTSITTLPPTLSQILSLRLLSKSDVTSRALVCKAFNTIATAHLYRDICFDVPNFAHTNEDRLERNKKLCSI